jgi:hypothetical protein
VVEGEPLREAEARIPASTVQKARFAVARERGNLAGACQEPQSVVVCVEDGNVAAFEENCAGGCVEQGLMLVGAIHGMAVDEPRVITSARQRAYHIPGLALVPLYKPQSRIWSFPFLRISSADVNARGEWGRTALFHAAQNGHTETVRALSACGADVNARDDFGRTPVWAAASFGHAVCVRALEACGADVESADVAGETPIFAAASQGQNTLV